MESLGNEVEQIRWYHKCINFVPKITWDEYSWASRFYVDGGVKTVLLSCFSGLGDEEVIVLESACSND